MSQPTSNKLNIVLGLVAVFLLVLGTNRIDQSHFNTAQEALTTVYEDRVIAQDYLYKMSLLNRLKEEQYRNDAAQSTIERTNKEFQELIEAFAQTKLTIKETEYLSNLRSTFQTISEQERAYFASNNTDRSLLNMSKLASRDLQDLQQVLNGLARIQLSESKNITSSAQKSLSMNNVVSWLEIGVLIAIGILIQYIIFYRTKKKVRRAQAMSPEN